MEGSSGAGKGDTYRKVDQKQWSVNWDKIFGKKPRKKGNNEQDERKDSKGNASRPIRRRTSDGKG